MWLSGIYSFLFRRNGKSDHNVTVLVDTERGRESILSYQGLWGLWGGSVYRSCSCASSIAPTYAASATQPPALMSLLRQISPNGDQTARPGGVCISPRDVCWCTGSVCCRCTSSRAIRPCTQCTLTYTEESMVARIIQQNKKDRGIQAIASDKKEAKRTVASVLRGLPIL
jgi:hypothetical protein